MQVIQLGEREILLVGTAHVSRESVDLVRELIAAERPDRVCIELDTGWWPLGGRVRIGPKRSESWISFGRT